MKKVALVFVLAVFGPSLVLAWLAVRSVRDQQIVLERQQSLLYEGVADSLAKQVRGNIAGIEHAFGLEVETLLAGQDPASFAPAFDDCVRSSWQMGEVGFVVNLGGTLLCPSPTSRPETWMFCADHLTFLGNREMAQVYWNPRGPNAPGLSANQKDPTPSLTEFRQLIGEANEGTLARFVDNKLSVLVWHRALRDRNLVFGAQLALGRLEAGFGQLVAQIEPALRKDVCVAILDDRARPVAQSLPGFATNWKRPFASIEIGDVLPHWETAVYLLDPSSVTRSAQTVRWTLGLLIGVLLLAIGIGSWLIVSDLNRQLMLARRKTDFVSNVSHELKTPLTSIRMFSELLSDGRVTDPDRRRSYLSIITAEAARLTRLINNVLDFARIERGEKKYDFQKCDLTRMVRETAESFRHHLEANGVQLACDLPDNPIWVNGDRDALAQVLVNLLSNAEKYSDQHKEISLQLRCTNGSAPVAEARVLDRGMGVPPGFEDRIFEQFFRAHDSLSSGIQGSGLGLTLARQIARAHGGDVVFEPREGGGSTFLLRLPFIKDSVAQSRAE